MKRLVFISIMVNLLYSCKEETSYRMQILIENTTDNKLTVKLFPKTQYIHGDLYDFSDIGGGFSDTEFEIQQNNKESLYISSNLDQEPYMLISKIFDSINIKPYNKDKIEMKFSIDTVIGYSENLFDSNSTWTYEKRNYDEPDNFNQNPVESHDYSFVISTDKYYYK